MFLAHCNCSKFCINVDMANMYAKKSCFENFCGLVVCPVPPNPVRKVEIPELLISKVDKNAFSVIVKSSYRETNKTLMVGCGQLSVVLALTHYSYNLNLALFLKWF